MFSFEVGRRPLVATLTARSLVTKVLLFVIGGESSESRGLSPTHSVPWERALNNCTQLNKIIQNWTQLNTKPINLNFLGLAPEWGISQEASRDLEEMGTSHPLLLIISDAFSLNVVFAIAREQKIKGYVQDNMLSESSSKHFCPTRWCTLPRWCIISGASGQAHHRCSSGCSPASGLNSPHLLYIFSHDWCFWPFHLVVLPRASVSIECLRTQCQCESYISY